MNKFWRIVSWTWNLLMLFIIAGCIWLLHVTVDLRAAMQEVLNCL